MLAAFLLTIVLTAASADDPRDAATLIGRLDAPSFDDRVAAYKALETLGGEALPSLLAATNSSGPHVRTRVRALIASIGRQVDSDRLTRPTLIPVDFHKRPLGEVVDTLNERHDLRLSLRLFPLPGHAMMGFGDRGQSKQLQELKVRPVTLASPQPLPFWEVIDRLCQAGALHYHLAFSRPFGPSPSPFYLIADHTGRGPVADSGPFRVQITAVSSEFERDFTNGQNQATRAAKPPGDGQLTVTLLTLSEPGLKLELNGAPIVTEATDDRGRSLVPAGRAQVDPNRPSPGVRLMGGQFISILLVAPDPSGKLIRRLTGKIPVIAVTRVSDPIVIALKDAAPAAKQVSTRNLTLVVDEISLEPGKPASVRVVVRPNRNGLAPRAGPDPRRTTPANFNRGDAIEHLELCDASGRRINYTLNEQTTGGDGQGFFSRYRVAVAPAFEDGPANGRVPAKSAVPAELRYYDFVEKATEIPFEFRDIPMP
jgi:hypothetical protein